jgi:outer membrane protein, multidrug efflux system
MTKRENHPNTTLSWNEGEHGRAPRREKRENRTTTPEFVQFGLTAKYQLTTALARLRERGDPPRRVGEGFADFARRKQPLTPGFAVPSPLGEGRYQLGPRCDSRASVASRLRGTRLLLILLLLVVFLPGCLVGPNYSRPKVNAPPAFRGAQGAAEQASFADLPWWEVFKDETLQGLIKTALVNNYDLRIAVTRIEQAQQVALEARAQFFPFFNYQGTIGGAKNPLGAIAAGGLGVTPKSQGAVLIAVTAAWEADVWGKIRRMNEAAKAQYLATEEAKRGVMLSLVSGVAQAYFQLLGLDLQLEIARQNTANFADTLKLFTERLEGGVASKLQTSRAAGAEYTAAATIPELERQIALTENEINVLLGQNPAPVPHTAKLLEETLPPEVPAGLPSALLERRPDILTAEQQVRAANAEIGVAQANFFPQISLTAFLGRGSSPLSNFTSPNALVWNALANAAGPIYQGGLLRAQKRQAIAAWEQTALEYQQTALDAFQDVSNALISRQQYEATRVEQARAVQAYEEAVKVAFQRYNAGKASYYEVLEAQQLLFPAQSNLAQTELNQRLVIVQLYKALGGGWNLQDPQWMGPQAPTSPTSPTAPKP